MSAAKLAILTNMVAPYRVPFFRELANNSRVQDLVIYTCTHRERDRQWHVENDPAYRVHRLGGITLNLNKGTDGQRILHFRFGIFWQLLRNRPDRLVIGDASWTTFLAVLACLLLRIKYVVWNEITTSSKVSEGLVAKLRRWTYRNAERCIASGILAKDFLINNGVAENRVGIVQNAVDNDFFLAQKKKLEPQRAAIREELGIAPDAYCFIFVGQLISRKRILETIELLIDLRQEAIIHFLVVGTGPLMQLAKEKAARSGFKDITFLGSCSPEITARYYAASDGLILLSDDEPWGMVINEALIFGKQIYSSEKVGAAIDFKMVNTLADRIKIRSPKAEDIHDSRNRTEMQPDITSPSEMAACFLQEIELAH